MHNNNNIHKVVVIGGGAAGTFAALSIKEVCPYIEVILIERNHKIGRKLYITGKGRCNLTNTNNPISKIVSNPKFTYSIFSQFTYKDTVSFFESHGLDIIEERGGRMFPKTNKSSDVIDVIYNELIVRGVTILFNETVTDLIQEKNLIKRIITNKQTIYADAVIIATGGVFYPHTGSDGTGFNILKNLGVEIVSPVPALTSMLLNCGDIALPNGLSLKNVMLSIKNMKGEIIVSDFGEMLFTTNGISGPIVLSLSSRINRNILNETLFASIDLKPTLSEDVLKNKIKDFMHLYGRQQAQTIIPKLTARRMTGKILKESNIQPTKTIADLSKDEILRLVTTLKNVEYEILSLDTERAVVTAGGVETTQINPKTMQYKAINNLFFAGEIIDVDALTGGYNLQFAFSSGFAAGKGVCKYLINEGDK